MAQAKPISSLIELNDYKVVCITGGEPLLNIPRTKLILDYLKSHVWNRPIFLYTALYDERIVELLPLLRGVHFSLHYGCDAGDVMGLQKLQGIAVEHPEISWRLYVDQRVGHIVWVTPRVWARIEMKPWLPEGECPLPPHEDLFILRSDAW